MYLPHRLETALDKLYDAYHSERLNPENCCQCAVGNICDNVDAWKHFTDIHGSTQLSYLGRLNQTMGKRINGYTPQELLNIEAVFLKACGYRLNSRQYLLKPAQKIDQELIFKGLSASVAYMCRLDNVENIMELYTKFDFQIVEKKENIQM